FLGVSVQQRLDQLGLAGRVETDFASCRSTGAEGGGSRQRHGAQGRQGRADAFHFQGTPGWMCRLDSALADSWGINAENENENHCLNRQQQYQECPILEKGGQKAMDASRRGARLRV